MQYKFVTKVTAIAISLSNYISFSDKLAFHLGCFPNTPKKAILLHMATSSIQHVFLTNLTFIGTRSFWISECLLYWQACECVYKTVLGNIEHVHT